MGWVRPQENLNKCNEVWQGYETYGFVAFQDPPMYGYMAYFVFGLMESKVFSINPFKVVP